jgi:hypothetical protein
MGCAKSVYHENWAGKRVNVRGGVDICGRESGVDIDTGETGGTRICIWITESHQSIRELLVRLHDRVALAGMESLAGRMR